MKKIILLAAMASALLAGSCEEDINVIEGHLLSGFVHNAEGAHEITLFEFKQAERGLTTYIKDCGMHIGLKAKRARTSDLATIKRNITKIESHIRIHNVSL